MIGHETDSVVYRDMVTSNDGYGIAEAQVYVLDRPDFLERYEGILRQLGVTAGSTRVVFTTIRGVIEAEHIQDLKPNLPVEWQNGSNRYEQGLSIQEVVRHRAEKTDRTRAYYDRGLIRRGFQIGRALFYAKSDYPAALPFGLDTPDAIILGQTAQKEVLVDNEFEKRYRKVKPWLQVFW